MQRAALSLPDTSESKQICWGYFLAGVNTVECPERLFPISEVYRKLRRTQQAHGGAMNDDSSLESLACSSGETDLSTRLSELNEESRRFAEAARSENTIRAYEADWRHFAEWCATYDASPLPAGPPVVRLYLTFMASDGYATSTISRRLSTIRQAHQMAGEEDPTIASEVREVWRGIRRTLGTAPDQKAALLVDDIRAICRAMTDAPKDLRDRALILVGWVGAFRRSELVALDVQDISFENSFALVRLRSSKTDQESHGSLKKLTAGRSEQTCPVRALKNWLAHANIDSGAVFRSVGRWGHVRDSRLSSRMVANIVKSRAASVGIDPSRVSGHSLRRGHVTEAARAGARKAVIQNQTGHASERMIEAYTEAADIIRDSSADFLGH
jgi:site-specific recombinase XerD